MRKETFIYTSPLVEVTEVEVEKGFALSTGIGDLQDGGIWSPEATTNASVSVDQLDSFF